METPVFEKKYVMNDAEWDTFNTGLSKLGAIAKEYGITMTYHHHMGTVVQTAAEIDRMMDGTDADSGCSYLDLAELIVQISARPNEDLRELWTRMAFFIAISNTDDHLRNHGFLWNGNGWSLSPAYDLNPNPEGNGLSLNITADDNTLDFDLALETAPFFRLSPQDANAVLAKIRDVTRQWRGYAKACGIPHAAQDLMAPAFRT